ncbi:YlbL family protein [Enemella sp. A6]|uniref:YlbL family protein n=1 Tax=Enemella sp. A6 TaxID=3440152 RepID=UPI003EBC48E2
MTRQTWTALVSAVLFVGLAAAVALVPVPFVTWNPGRTVNVLAGGEPPALDVAGARSYPTTGELHLTTVSTTRVDSTLGLPEGVIAHWLPNRDTMPREVIHPPGQSAEESQAEDKRMMDTSQQNAVVAALRQADLKVTEHPAVGSVNVGGPSDGLLEPGDLIMAVDGRSVATPEDVSAAVHRVTVGATLEMTVLRAGTERAVQITTTASNADPKLPAIGIGVQVGYKHAAQITIVIDPRIGGPSAGLVFALGIYDLLTPGALLEGNVVAGTGTISPDGRVGGIGGVHEKIRAAEESGAQLFLLPEANCSDLGDLSTNVKVAKVATLDDAVKAIRDYAKDGPAAVLPTCER